MSEIKIEKGIPLAEVVGRKYPWHEMDVGDSFLTETLANSAIACANKRYAPKRFSARKVEGGVRVWRVE